MIQMLLVACNGWEIGCVVGTTVDSIQGLVSVCVRVEVMTHIFFAHQRQNPIFSEHNIALIPRMRELRAH